MELLFFKQFSKDNYSSKSAEMVTFCFRSMYAILHVTESTHEHETKSESPEIEVSDISVLNAKTVWNDDKFVLSFLLR